MSGQGTGSTEQPPPSQQPPLEYLQWAHDHKREDAHRAHDRQNKFWDQVNEATIKSAETVLRMAMLINGGAAVSVLAFIGGLVSQNRIAVSDLKGVSNSLMLFAFGVLVSVAGMALAYLTHYFTTAHANSMEKIWEHPWVRPGPRSKLFARVKMALHLLALLVCFASLLLFVSGMFAVRDAIVAIGDAHPAASCQLCLAPG